MGKPLSTGWFVGMEGNVYLCGVNKMCLCYG